ncbi:enoyl-CoA hydratase [Gordonia sinesedis]
MDDADLMDIGVAAAVDARGVGRIEIARPDRMNALSHRASRFVADTLTEWSTDDAVRVVVLDGAGGNFSAGADIVDIAQRAASTGTDSGGLDRHQAHSTISTGSNMVKAVRSVRVPVIAAVDGAAVGIGASLALVADLAFATARSYFLLAFINIGLMPDGAASATVAAAMGRARANRMILLGEKLPATEAFDAGLISGLVADRDDLDATVDAVVAKLLASSPEALRLAKESVDAETMHGFDAALERELAGQTKLLQSPEFRAALRRFTGGVS